MRYGSEFKGPVTEMLTKHGVNIRRSTTKYNHSHTAFVENLIYYWQRVYLK